MNDGDAPNSCSGRYADRVFLHYVAGEYQSHHSYMPMKIGLA